MGGGGGARGAGAAPPVSSDVPFPFAFASRPGMDPTNNESERTLRKVVIAGKIRYGIASRTGASMFSNIMTCMLAWKKRNLNVSDMLPKALKGTYR